MGMMTSFYVACQRVVQAGSSAEEDDMAVESRISQVGTGTGALPPGPKGLPVVGPLLELKKDLLGTSYGAMLEFGDVVRFAGAPGKYHREATFLFHPDMVQYVLATGAD